MCPGDMPAPGPAAADAGLAPFKDLVRRRCGLVFEGVAEATLANALGARQAACRSASRADYFARALVDEEEFRELVALLTINETYFFREPEQLALLVDRLVPRLLARRGTGRPLRLLSAGCSTGEEPYSLAMALAERYPDTVAHLFTIDAGDIDHHALAKARSGRYGDFSFRGVAPAIRERWFVSSGQHHQLHERIRALVRFQRLNLLAEQLPEELHGVDVILFRNVSIYFDEPTRRTIQARLAGLLADDGLLLVGSAETLANTFGILHLVEEDGLFYFAKAGSPPPLRRRALPLPSSRPTPAAPPRPPAPAPVAPQAAIDTIRDLLRAKHFAPAAAQAQALAEALPQDARPPALLAFARMQQRDFDGARAAAEQALARDEWSLDAAVLLGLCAKWQQRGEEAVRRLRQAVYARPECWPAQFYLGELYRAAGNDEPARRAYRLALRHLAAGDGGLLVPLGLPAAEVRLLCQRHLAAPPTEGR